MKLRLLVVMLLVVAAQPPAFAYPIPAQTLWQQVKNADAVVVAEVVGLADLPMSPTTFKDVAQARGVVRHGLPSGVLGGTFFYGRDTKGFAQLRVVQTLKGPPLTDLWVVTNAGMVCPAPPKFVTGKTVLVFLASDGDAAWEVQGLSYGTLYPSAADLEVFRARIEEAAALQSAEKLDENAQMDWLVRTAARRATRWHGLYELHPAMDAVHHFYDRGEKAEKPRLTDAQRAALAQGFVDEPSSGTELAMMVDAVGEHPSPAFDAVTAGILEAQMVSGGEAWWLWDALRAIASRKHLESALQDLAGLKDHEARTDPVVVRGVWERMKKQRPELQAAPISVDNKRSVEGVGADTPP